MNTYLKLTSVKTDNKNCNCISPFYINDMQGINPNTGRYYSKEDENALKTALYRISNAKNCTLSVCCDPNDPNSKADPAFIKKFISKFPKIMPMYDRSTLKSIKLSNNKNVVGPDWVVPTTYMICKISKATIIDTPDPTIKMATNLVNDCFTNQCSNVENITLDTLLQSSKADMKYSYVDDARVTQAILDNDISYVKEYIAQYKVIDSPLTNNTYNNRMIHLAAQNINTDILSMLIALKSNINVKNNANETPIHFAVRSKNIDAIDILLNQGVDLSIPTINGETPMFYAMKTGDLRIIKMLYNNNSPVLGVDKSGNNLIHYCILYCPSFKDEITKGSLGDIIIKPVKSDKRDIIKFLIERGINTEELNNDGISSLELSQKEINRELNKECALGIQQDTEQVLEHFFNIKPIREAMSSAQPTNESTSNNVSKNVSNNVSNNVSKNVSNNVSNNKNTSQPKNTNQPKNTSENTTNKETDTVLTTTPNINNYGARRINKELSGYTSEHKQLLEIQTLLFNNIIKNNPNKYSGYISVDDIPKGAPIEVLDTVCVGNGMTGNEDTDECISKGGQLVKIENRTTKIKLELLPEDNILIDAEPQKDLYYKKIPDKIPKGTMPPIIQNYNTTITSPNVPQTTGITYNIGETSSNEIDSLEGTNGFNPKPTVHASKVSSDNTPKYIDHPSMFDDYDDIVHKCKKDAINNSTTIQNNKNNNNEEEEIDYYNLENYDYFDKYNLNNNEDSTLEDSEETKKSFFEKYKIPLIVFTVIILLIIIGIIIYHFYF
jgi:ankyrin repeat protein